MAEEQIPSASLSTITNIATTAAGNVLSNLPLVELVHGTNHTYYALGESAISNAVFGDTINLKGIINAYTNWILPGGLTISFNGATVTNNVNMTAAGPLIIPGGNGDIINGPGSVFPAADHSTVYHAAIGSDSRLVNQSFTNLAVNRLAMYGDSDVVFIWQTNYCSAAFNGCTISSLTNAAWDIVLCTSSNNLGSLTFTGDHFYLGPVVSSLSGAQLRGVGIGGIIGTFNSCDFTADGTLAATHCFDTAGASGTLSNTLNNCTFTVLGGSASFAFLISSTGVNGYNTLNNCSFTGQGAGTAIKFSGSASTNTFNNVTVSGFTTVLSLSAGAYVINTGGNIRGNQVTTTPYNFIDETGQVLASSHQWRSVHHSSKRILHQQHQRGKVHFYKQRIASILMTLLRTILFCLLCAPAWGAD